MTRKLDDGNERHMEALISPLRTAPAGDHVVHGTRNATETHKQTAAKVGQSNLIMGPPPALPQAYAIANQVATRRTGGSDEVIPPPDWSLEVLDTNHRLGDGARETRMPLKRPAVDPATLQPRTSSGYPEPFRSRVLPREKRSLGDALGLTRIGVNMTTLLPGKESSMRHFHTREDELVFVLEGEVVLRTDEGEQLLIAGTCAGFPAGSRNGHQLLNRSDRPARYLEISNRDPEDAVEYPDVDLAYRKAPDGTAVFTRKDGTPHR